MHVLYTILITGKERGMGGGLQFKCILHVHSTSTELIVPLNSRITVFKQKSTQKSTR